MEHDGALIRSVSKLEVISPKSPVGRSEANSRILAERRERRQNRQSGDQNLPTPQIVTKTPPPRISIGSSSINDQPLVGEAQVIADQVPVTEPGPRTIVDVVTALPSWLVSFVAHLALMLILALCTLSSDFRSPVSLELAQISPDQFDSMTVEIELDDAEIEDMDDASLEEPESESELPPLELSVTEPVPESFDQDEFEVKELAEFAMPESNPVPAGGDPVGDAAMNNGDAGENEGEATEFFGAKSYGANFVFVIDASSSMINNYRWTRAVRELLDTLDQLEEDKKFLVLLYNDRSYMMFGAPDDQKLIQATEENKRKISYWLSNATPFGGTRPGRSVQLALKKNPDAIYFLSDGELRDNTMFDLRTWNRPRLGKDGLKRKISIHTILLGSNFGRRTMEIIAKENNGIFTRVN